MNLEAALRPYLDQFNDELQKYLVKRDLKPVELYDARNDPGHTRNLSEEKKEVVEKLHQMYVTWLKEMKTPEDRLVSRLEL